MVLCNRLLMQESERIMKKIQKRMKPQKTVEAYACTTYAACVCPCPTCNCGSTNVASPQGYFATRAQGLSAK